MFPDHCKEVSVRYVDFDLCDGSIRSFLSGKRAYIRTKYIVMTNGHQWAVVRIEKEAFNGVLQPISSIDIVSLPEETSFIDDRDLDVLSASKMGLLRESEGTKCVVVRGRSEHVSFFVDQRPFKLTVVDVVPPSPSKLVGLVDDVLDSQLQDFYVKYDVVELDINGLSEDAGSGPVLFPCRASGLEHENMLGYLDGTPSLTPEQISSVSLVGCSLSARIFKAMYRAEPRLVNMCPVDLLSKLRVTGPVLTKCCKVKEGYDLRGDVAIVPWGARATDVAAAIEALLRCRADPL
ncbi:MAG TPA: hypothetical protein VMW71_04345 [Thermoplasmata archaeon]|nr:hypothetical protein [Thermoplasmata archaeon]